MSNDNMTYKLFDQNGCLNQEGINLYLGQKLQDDELKQVQSHLEECPFCSDAIEGYKGKKITNINDQVDQVNLMTDQRTGRGQGKTTRINKPFVYLATAASIALLAGLFFLVMKDYDTPDKTIAEKHDKIEKAEQVKTLKEDKGSNNGGITGDNDMDATSDQNTPPVTREESRGDSKTGIDDSKVDLIPKNENQPLEKIEIEAEEEVAFDLEEEELMAIEPVVESTAGEGSTNRKVYEEDYFVEETKNNQLSQENIMMDKHHEPERGLFGRSKKGSAVKRKESMAPPVEARQSLPTIQQDTIEYTVRYKGQDVDAFARYLKEEMSRNGYIEGVYEVEFIVDPAGAIKDVKILEGAREQGSELIKKLIRESEGWSAPTLGGMPIQKQIHLVIDLSE